MCLGSVYPNSEQITSIAPSSILKFIGMFPQNFSKTRMCFSKLHLYNQLLEEVRECDWCRILSDFPLKIHETVLYYQKDSLFRDLHLCSFIRSVLKHGKQVALLCELCCSKQFSFSRKNSLAMRLICQFCKADLTFLLRHFLRRNRQS